MFNTKSASQHAVDEFFRALSERDVSIASNIPETLAVGLNDQPCWSCRSIGLRRRHQRARRIGERAAYLALRCELVQIRRLLGSDVTATVTSQMRVSQD